MADAAGATPTDAPPQPAVPFTGEGSTVDQGGLVLGRTGIHCTIYGIVKRAGVVGDHSTVMHRASVEGTVGNNCQVGAGSEIKLGSHVGDHAHLGAGVMVDSRVTVAGGFAVPAGARITDTMAAARRGDVLCVGLVGSEARGRYVTVARQPDGAARLIVGCWNSHQGGSADQLEARIGADPWTRDWPGSARMWGGDDGGDDETSVALRALYYAQYAGIVALARSLERAWLSPAEAPHTDSLR